MAITQYTVNDVEGDHVFTSEDVAKAYLLGQLDLNIESLEGDDLNGEIAKAEAAFRATIRPEWTLKELGEALNDLDWQLDITVDGVKIVNAPGY